MFASQPYCGVYAIYGAAKAIGSDVEFQELVDPQFISSGRGSSVEDLQKAANHLGVRATPLFGLGRTTLFTASDPLCLHVSRFGSEGTYNHWVLFLGIDGDDAMIHDGPGGVTRCSIESLLARWDGVALAITEPGASTAYLGNEVRGMIFILVGAAIILLLLDRVILRFQLSFGRQFIVFLSCVLLSSGVLYGRRGMGPAAHQSREGIDAALGFKTFANIEISELASVIEESNPIIVDSRFRHDFARRSIPNAINLPVDIGLGEFRSRTSQLQRGRPVIVFCQSKECHFSSIVAAMLSGEGFTDVRILGEGYVGWRKQR